MASDRVLAAEPLEGAPNLNLDFLLPSMCFGELVCGMTCGMDCDEGALGCHDEAVGNCDAFRSVGHLQNSVDIVLAALGVLHE